MGITKKINRQNIFIFLFLVIFPFGQIIRIGMVHPLDIVVGLAAIYTILKKLEKPQVFTEFKLFLYAAAFSWIFSLFIFKKVEVFYGLLYLIRIISYYYFGIYVWNFAKKTKEKKLLQNSLVTISVVSAIFGWIQFLAIPDIKPFFVYGWDMHLFRLVGTFLDPTFLGLIIVFGLLLSIYLWTKEKSKGKALTIGFLLVSLAFTYSRASYLAFVAGILLYIYFDKRFKKLLLLVLTLIIGAFLLPTARNHSIELFRTFSSLARIQNYKNTLQVFGKSPVFGIGFNNMCLANNEFVAVQSFESHACSGSDSSLLMVLATTGITGLIVFLSAIIKIIKLLFKKPGFEIIYSCFLALFVHSLFSNSLFYPWVMGYLAVLPATFLKD